MPLPIVMLAFGERRYLDEALAGIAWHRERGLKNTIELWIDPSFGEVNADAIVRRLEPVSTNSPSLVVGWYYKTLILRDKCRENGAFCLLDAYARVLRPDLFDEMESTLARFPLAMTLDPRGTLAKDLSVGRGVSPDVAREISHLPGLFPLWNTGVIFARGASEVGTLTHRLEAICRGYLDRGLMIREQIALVRAVNDTSIAPLTLPDNYNVRRPFIDPAIVLHTRRYGRFYGIPEVDTEATALQQLRQRIKVAAAKALRLKSLWGG